MSTSSVQGVDASYWRGRLRDALTDHQVPGAALGILRDGAIVDVAAGVLSRATLVEATPDSVFQTGSITKVWTATLMMQLVDEGRIELTTPVVEILPGFRTADPDATRQIEVRHLLTHTSGIAGDVFLETGRGDECLERYVADLSGAAQIHPVGATYSYCNAGYSVAGRIIEVLTGMVWDEVLRRRIIEPLGLEATVTLPEEAILHRAAVGHLSGSGAAPVPTSRWVLPRSGGPAGRVTARVHDVLSFTRMHLAHGSAPDGTAILSAASARAMATEHVKVPGGAVADGCGLGWQRYDWSGHGLIGHDGGTIGQRAFLRASPETGLAACLLTNGGDAVGLYQELFGELFTELAGVTMPAPLMPPTEPARAADHRLVLGRYRGSGLEFEVTERAGAMVLRTTAIGLFAELFPGQDAETPLVPVAVNQFATKRARETGWSPVCFSTVDAVTFIHVGGRATPRISSC